MTTPVLVLILAVLAIGPSPFLQFDMSEPGAKDAIGYNICVIVFLGALDLLAGGAGSIRGSSRP